MTEGASLPARPIRVLFVCTHNSARSQIAEALLVRDGGDDFAVSSAGTEVSPVNPYAIIVLEEAGIDWSAARSTSPDGCQYYPGVLTVWYHSARCGLSRS